MNTCRPGGLGGGIDVVAQAIAQECLASRVRRLDRELTRHYNQALRPWDVTSTQLSLLVTIGLAGPISSKELAERSGLEPSTVSRNLARLSEKGWCAARSGQDARVREWSLASKGADLIRDASVGWEGAQRRAEGILKARERSTIANFPGPGDVG